MVLVHLLLAALIGLSPLYIPTPCGSERASVVSTKPLDELSLCWGRGGGMTPEWIAGGGVLNGILTCPLTGTLIVILGSVLSGKFLV